MTEISDNETNSQIPLLMLCLAFEWNFEDFYGIFLKKTVSEKILGKQ